MEIGEHLEALHEDGVRLAEAAERAGTDAPVPTCPGWRVGDLLGHVGGVHRWAAAQVRTGNPRPQRDQEVAAAFARPPDGELLDWYRAGHAALVTTLREADPEVACWTFLAAPSPLAFWARRQAHETAIHRIDAETAAGQVRPCAPRFAVDGIDELLTGFLARPRGRLTADPPVSLAVRATDADAAWTIRIEPDRRVVSRDADGSADCTVSGPATRIYPMLWNRAGTGGLDVRGDLAVLDLWRDRARVTWS